MNTLKTASCWAGGLEQNSMQADTGIGVAILNTGVQDDEENVRPCVTYQHI